MEVSNRKRHWETIYQTKEDIEVCWYQDKPEATLQFFNQEEGVIRILIVF